jgi:glycolate oxidase FAD binding subunit
MMYGGVRDLVIGMKMVLAGGARIKAGGKVVKNVAGYDLGKLFVGSLGTLGIITEVTFRVAPLPESAASFVASGTLDRCARFVAELSRSPLLPAAVTIAGPETVKVAGGDSGTPPVATIVTWVEGFEEAIARHVRDLQDMAGRAGLSGEVLRDQSHKKIWDEIRDFGWDDRGVLYRLIVPIASVADALAEIDRSNDTGKRLRYVAHAGTGTVWLRLDAEPPAMQWFPRLAALALQHKGHAVIATAPAELKVGIDVWGEAPASLKLMREIKRQFDPKDVLSPGRFIAGL